MHFSNTILEEWNIAYSIGLTLRDENNFVSSASFTKMEIADTVFWF